VSAVVALLAGLLFGGGLLLSGMSDPDNVLAFLDVGGAWRANLAFTMAGAIAIALPAYAYAKARGRSLSGAAIGVIGRARIDRRLVLGSALFGVGWGLSGICPGPGLLLVATGTPLAAIFIVGYVVGVYAVDSLAPRTAGTEPERDPALENGVF
jgi:uncharacterized membrane protein YedE/YeeE